MGERPVAGRGGRVVAAVGRVAVRVWRRAALRAGRVVVPVTGTTGVRTRTITLAAGRNGFTGPGTPRLRVPATLVPVSFAATQWILPPSVADRLHLEPVASGLLVNDLDAAERGRVARALAGLGLALYTPLQYLFVYVAFGWPLTIGLGIVAVLSGYAVGRLWGGPDWAQSARTAAITAVVIASMVFLDRVMQVWPDFFGSQAIGGRPIATVGDATPNLGGDFWVRTLDSYTHLVLPTISLLLISFAGYTRYSRASMLEVMGQDYIRTARAKGLSERTVVMRHGFRNSLIPLATIVPLDIVALFGGAIITEQVFGRPGMGQLFIKSLHNAEIEPIMAYLVITASLAILANIVADLIYAALDPRIRVNA